MTHTPGPWTFCKGGEYFPHVHIPFAKGPAGPKGLSPTRNCGPGDILIINAGYGASEEHEANAHLIAKAPEMWELLWQLTHCHDTATRAEIATEARALLREIEGEAQP